MSEEEYFEKRVKDQIDWYGKKSAWNKTWFMRLKISETVLALLIPLLTGYIGITENPISIKFIVGAIGVAVAAMANLITLFKFQENWIEYRTTVESLIHEKFLYVTKAGPYKDDSTFPMFVERFESFLAKENAKWASYIKTQKEEKPKTVAGADKK
ncbi:MAG: DUF4231 domain-containing protein [Bacteroidetes bacterium]|nr:DUF4231 domain-containing protein [Bacteroidota bacterium]